MTRVRIFAAFLFVLLCGGGSGLPEGTGSLTFQAWAGFGVGSSVTLESTAENPKGTLPSTKTQKLIEKADDHLVLEDSTTVIYQGQQQPVPTTKVTVQAAPDPTISMTQVGSEDVTAGGKTYSCKIYTVTNSQSGPNVNLKLWTCTDVPGGIVKMEMNGPSLKIRSVLKSFEAK